MNCPTNPPSDLNRIPWIEELFRQVIQSSINAIVAVDRKGNVIIFNQEAENIFGYRASEVIGKIHIEKLYPPGMAREIMRMIRSPDYGGAGVVRDLRTYIVAKDGSQVPVRLSGALVYHEGQEVASVGYFMDLRESIRLEKQMADINRKLSETEKEIALAELAGALAHELNQPLTTIASRIFLIEKGLDAGNPIRASVEIIKEEVNKMADIVRRIGQVTRYETRSYAGRAQIIDLRHMGSKETGE